VRKLIKIALVALGIRALLRWYKRRKAAALPVAEPGPPADPADELRQKLAENRSDGPAAEPPAASETTVEDRRAQVHEQGRSTLEDMKSADEG
jgi:hypothetical protein